MYIYLFILFGLVPLSGRAQTILPARGTAYLFCVLCPIFATLGSTLTFLKSKLVLNSLESIFPSIHAHLFIYLFFGLVPLAGRILIGSDNTTV